MTKNAQIVSLGFEPRATVWKARTNPLSHGGLPTFLPLPLTGQHEKIVALASTRLWLR